MQRFFSVRGELQTYTERFTEKLRGSSALLHNSQYPPFFLGITQWTYSAPANFVETYPK